MLREPYGGSIGPVTAVRHDLHSGSALLRLPFSLRWGMSLDEGDAGAAGVVGVAVGFEACRHVVDVTSVQQSGADHLFDQG